MRVSAVTGALALLVTACSPAESGPPLGVERQAIVRGTPSPAAQDAAVLISERGYAICTGVLIAPNLVLTARHCVTDYNDRSDCGGPLGSTATASSLVISVGRDASPDDYAARGARLFLPDANQLCSADIALIALDDDIQEVTPAKIRFDPPSAGDLATAVGYGDDDGPREQRADVKVLAIGPSRSTYRTESGYSVAMNVSAGEVSTTESTCFGDSGGPLFDADGRVVAVASRGLDERCRDRPALWTTFAGHAALIKDAASAAGHPIDEAATSAPASTSGTPAATGPTSEPGRATDATKDGEGGATRGARDGLGDDGCNAAGSPPALSPVLVALSLLLLARRRRAGPRLVTPGEAGRRAPTSGAT